MVEFEDPVSKCVRQPLSRFQNVQMRVAHLISKTAGPEAVTQRFFFKKKVCRSERQEGSSWAIDMKSDAELRTS